MFEGALFTLHFTDVDLFSVLLTEIRDLSRFEVFFRLEKLVRYGQIIFAKELFEKRYLELTVIVSFEIHVVLLEYTMGLF